MDLTNPRGWGYSTFLVGMCPLVLKSRVEGAGFPGKMRGLGVKILKFYVLRVEILIKKKAENAKFFYKLKMGAHERHIDGNLVG